jgi:hypothetical protein
MHRAAPTLLHTSRTRTSALLLRLPLQSPLLHTARRRAFATQNSFSSPSLRLLKPSPSELAARKLGPRNIRLALEALKEDGIVAIEGVVREKELDAVSSVSASLGAALTAKS